MNEVHTRTVCRFGWIERFMVLFGARLWIHIDTPLADDGSSLPCGSRTVAHVAWLDPFRDNGTAVLEAATDRAEKEKPLPLVLK